MNPDDQPPDTLPRLTSVPAPAADPRPLCSICGQPLHPLLTEARLGIHDGHERTTP